MPVGNAELDYAERKWASGAEYGNRFWRGDQAAYCRGLARYGVPESSCMSGIGARYQQGWTRPGTKERQLAGVQYAAQNDLWANHWLRKMTGATA